MKMQYLILSTLAVYLCTSISLYAQTIIQGRIKGGNPPEISYSIPVQGTYFWTIGKKYPIQSGGVFHVTLELTSASFVTIFIPGNFRRTLIVEPDMQYDLEIDISSPEQKIVLKSNSNAGQKLYKELTEGKSFYSQANKQIRTPSIADFKKNIVEAKKEELLSFKKLLDNNVISEDFFQLVALDRTCYYSAMLSYIAYSKSIQNNRKGDSVFPDEVLDMWAESAKLFEENQDLRRSRNYFMLVEYYLSYREYLDKGIETEDFNDQGLYQKNRIQLAHKYLQEPVLEYYQAAFIASESVQLEFEMGLIELFNQFKEEYPESKFSEYVENLMNPILAFRKARTKKGNSLIKFVRAYNNINSLEEGLKGFSDQKLYIDIWATWCGPCKEQFQYVETLRTELSKQNVNILYISTDEQAQESQWKDMIKFYDLQGYHIRANKRLLNDLTENYGVSTIPRYFLVDSKGIIQNIDAPEPSQIDLLRAEFKKLQ